MTLLTAPTDALNDATLHGIRTLLEEAFRGNFSEHDWAHALGGVHVWLSEAGTPIAHASVVERMLTYGATGVLAGYVEAVATASSRRRQGHGSRVMRRANDLIREHYHLGALSSGTPAFYATLGWELWRGPTSCRGPRGLERTPDDDGSIMILRTPRTPALDLDAAIVCDWRPGEVW